MLSVKDFFGKSIKSTDEDLEDDQKKKDHEQMLKLMEEGKRKHKEKLEKDAASKVYAF